MRSDADEQINFGRLILKTMEMEKLDMAVDEAS